MKHKLLSMACIAITSFSFAQANKVWKTTVKNSESIMIANKQTLNSPRLFALDVMALQQSLTNAPKRFNAGNTSVIVYFPNAEGSLEKFSVQESSNMAPELAARYSEIKTYVGQGVDNPTSTIYFSLSPLGLQTMVIKADQSAEFIEPFTTDLSAYAVYKKTDKAASLNRFECKVIANAQTDLNGVIAARPNADDGKLRNFRLAMSVTGEYTAYFGGTKALALAAINNSLTRVNGVFEKDFGVHLNLIANTDLVIYTSSSSDPYSAATAGSGGAWNQELQTTLTNVIGSANYDIGHLFGASGGGGNAGCIACVCINPTTGVPLGKGSGYTSPADAIPQGDNFDIDYVAHEMGHQFGANHTFTQGVDTATTTNSNDYEGTGAQMEPGSGSTIMGYAGITIKDVQPHSDAYFHAFSIQQVTNYIKTTTCQTTTVTGNAIPTASAGLDYTVPKSTPFMLTGTGTDANGDALTYNWEQMNAQTTNASPSATKTTGVNFRSFLSTTSTTRYFPKMSSVLTGATTTAGSELTVEALPSVARTLNFRVTVRDNRAGGPANNSDDMILTVNATAGPFTVSAPNTAVSYVGGSSQTITWNVAGTTTNGVNCANVDILLSTNAGSTWTTLLAATPNDGTQAVTIPNTAGTTNRIMVKGTNHVFFDVSNTNFTITAGSSDTIAPSAPTSLAASGTTQTTTNLSWTASTDNVVVTGYDVYQGATLLGSTTTATTYAVTGLTASTAYTFSVKAKDAAANISAASNVVNVSTLAALDTTAPSAPTSLAASGTTQTTTNLSWTASTDNVAVTGYDVYQGASLLGSTTTATTYAVTGLTASTAYTFSVKAKDAAANISAASNDVNVTTLAASGSNTDLLFSEYIEGSSFNKAIEIANGTGSAVDLSIYTVKKQTNGAGAWSTGLALSGTLNNGAKYVIVHSSIALACYTAASANISTAANEVTFNGNDAVGLFKNGVLIDIIGNFNGGTANFAIDVTLRRKATVTSPNTTFSITGEWDSFGIDTCGGLNSRFVTNTEETNLDFVLYPNPVDGNQFQVSLANGVNYRIVNSLGQVITYGTLQNGTISAANLVSGIYLLEVTSNGKSVSKRFIKQ